MLVWMLYVVLVTLMVGFAALAAEKVARLRRAPSRWIWLLAMACSLLIPTVSVSVRVPAFISPQNAGQATGLGPVTYRALSLGTGSPPAQIAPFPDATSIRGCDAVGPSPPYCCSCCCWVAGHTYGGKGEAGSSELLQASQSS
jgi:hypothetical protein